MTGEPLASLEELEDRAVRHTGFSDFGDPDHREPGQVLVDSFNTDAQLTRMGADRFEGVLVAALSARLGVEHHWPRLAATASGIERPVFIAGLPRSGTTLLHRLLCADERFQGLEYWLTQAPQPRPPVAEWPQHPAYQAAKAVTDRRKERDPTLEDIHSVSPAMVEECWRIEQTTLRSTSFECMAHLPGYSTWLQAADLVPTYQAHRRALTVIGANDPHRRWMLKLPAHLMNLPALLAVYPDALVVQLHRDPRNVIPSISSLNYRSQRGTSALDTPADAGRQSLEFWSRALRANLRDRAQLPDGALLDVRYADLVTRPDEVLDDIYAWLGMARQPAEPVPARAGKPHHYDLTEYGLTEDQVVTAMADYRDAFPDVWNWV